MRSQDPNPLFPPPRPQRGDLVAGVSVALILIPQSLAYAEIAGLPPIRGLFAASLPLIAAALVASSPYLQTGPGAMTALLTFGALSILAVPGSDEYIGLAALLALIVGTVRVIIGVTRVGRVAHFLSRPVIDGFTSAAALLVIASQIPIALGVRESGTGGLLERAFDAATDPGAWDPFAVVTAVVVVVVVVGGRRVDPRFPSILVAVVGGIVASLLLPGDYETLGSLSGGMPDLSLAVPWSRWGDLLIPGVVIAVVGFAEPAAISMTYAARDRTRWDADREFVGQGLANLAAGVSGAFPVGGSFSRSAINRLSGARTRWAGAITGLGVLAFLPATGLLEPLPNAVLAGIVVAAVAPLFRPHAILLILRRSRPQGMVAVTTFVFTLALSPRVDIAVLIGIGIGIAIHLARELGIEVTTSFEEGELRMRLEGVLYFASAHQLQEVLIDTLAEHPETTKLLLDLERLGRLDYTAAMTLKAFTEQAADAGLNVEIVGVTQTVERMVDSVWPERLLGSEAPDAAAEGD